MQTYGIRLEPGDDLRLALKDFVQQHQIQAGVILSAIGSLTQANLRFAACSQTTTLPGPLELISLDGTLSQDGLHLHGTVADGNGQLSAGHIGEGCIVRTTAEIAIASLPHLIFRRIADPKTGYPELSVEPGLD
jgi:predicted DNA-binding protein with PD1-like motif